LVADRRALMRATNRVQLWIKEALIVPFSVRSGGKGQVGRDGTADEAKWAGDRRDAKFLWQ
jgi:hypothetical protein